VWRQLVQRDKVDLFAHNKKKDRLAETAMLYFTLTVKRFAHNHERARVCAR
jgi:hypothetical protein